MTLKNIPVCLPRLVSATQILPYLEQIDKNRWYSNFGPLTEQFLSRMAALFNISTAQIVSGINGTLLLQLCLNAFGVKPGSFCVMPAWTFVATPLAAAGACLEPLFVDVDMITQSIDPEKLLNDLPKLARKGEIGAVIVTAPFGKPISISAWDQFTNVTGIPVLIDAAAAFDTILEQSQMQVSSTPMMVSLHATKTFAVGEGGILLSTNEKLINTIKQMTQFGFSDNARNAYFRGTNAKISEYVAAVGLATLDHWPALRVAWQQISSHYQEVLRKAKIEHILSPNWVTSTCNVILPHQSDFIMRELASQGIMTRKWWSDGCHHQAVFKDALNFGLYNTEYLQASVLGLPFYVDMKTKTIDEVVEHLVSVKEGRYSFFEASSV